MAPVVVSEIPSFKRGLPWNSRMTQVASSAAPVSPAPFEVYSVHFDFPGGQAVRLVDPAINQPNPNQPVTIGATPEWVVNVRNELAAYVSGTRPDLRVVFRATPTS